MSSTRLESKKTDTGFVQRSEHRHYSVSQDEISVERGQDVVLLRKQSVSPLGSRYGFGAALLSFTPDEARDIARRLLDAADQIEAAPNGG